MSYREKFEELLRSSNPTAALRDFAMKLAAEGRNQRQVYEIFLEFHGQLQDEDREDEENLLGDVMDMIVGYYVGNNLDIPDGEARQ